MTTPKNPENKKPVSVSNLLEQFATTPPKATRKVAARKTQLDELAIELLDKKIREAIQKTEVEQEKARPFSLQMHTENGKLFVGGHIRVSTKKAIAIVGSVIGVLGALLSYLLPSLESVFQKITSSM